MDEREKEEVKIQGAMSRLGGKSKLDKQAQPVKKEKKKESTSKKSLTDTFLELAPLLIGTAVGGLPAGLDAQTQVGAINQAGADRQREIQAQEQEMTLKEQQQGLNQEKFEFQKDVQQINELDRADQRDLQRQQLGQQQEQFDQTLEFKNKTLNKDITMGLKKLEADKSKAADPEKLRKEYTQVTKDLGTREVVNSYKKLKRAVEKPSAAGDISLIFSYMKMLDPRSTVREGEFATAAESGSVPEKVRAQYNKAVSGKRLSDNIRLDFLTQSENLIKSQLESQASIDSRFADLANRTGRDATLVVDPTFSELNQSLNQAQEQGAQQTSLSKRSRLEELRRKYAK